ncbi:MAG: zinc-ribbon domain containing protein [Candidatus Peregrinibacteria bacterium]
MKKGQTHHCRQCKKEFLVIAQEQAFYQQKKLPFPQHCPECRRDRRRGLRNERKLYERRCDKCHLELLSTYAKDCPYIVYCEDCYYKQVN